MTTAHWENIPHAPPCKFPNNYSISRLSTADTSKPNACWNMPFGFLGLTSIREVNYNEITGNNRLRF